MLANPDIGVTGRTAFKRLLVLGRVRLRKRPFATGSSAVYDAAGTKRFGLAICRLGKISSCLRATAQSSGTCNAGRSVTAPDRLTRFGPFSSQCRTGNVKVRRGRHKPALDLLRERNW